MLTLSLQTLKARWTTFVGSFLALALGVCLLTITGLSLAATLGRDQATDWYANADLVVTGSDTVTVTYGAGDAAVQETTTTADAAPVPADIPARIAAMGGVDEVVVDRRVPVHVDGWDGYARPWSSAAMHPYSLLAGGPPTSGEHVVLGSAASASPGERIVVQTPAGPRAMTVAGVVDDDAGAIYLSDDTVNELAGGRIEAVAIRMADGARAADLAQRISRPGLRVLTGDARSLAEPDRHGDKLAFASSLLGSTTGVAAFVSVFVVAGTFSFAVVQRRREFALLRTAGATPRQLRRLVLGEALAVGVLASATGGALGTVVAAPFASWLARVGLAPPGFTARPVWWPLVAAMGVGLLVALTGAMVAARRAARVRPLDAMREAAVDRRVMTVGRWIFGLLSLAGAGALLAAVPASGPDGLGLLLVDAQLALIAAALLAPVLVPLFVRVVGWPLAGSTGQLARCNALAAKRRTASTATPILVTIGLAATTLAATATLWETQQRSAQDRITAATVVTPASSAGIGEATVTALGQQPGVRAAVPVRSAEAYVRRGDQIEGLPAMYVGAGVTEVLNLPTLAGSVDAVHQYGGADGKPVPVAVSRSAKWSLDDVVSIWLADGTPVRLRVAAVLDDSLDLDRTLLLPWDLGRQHGPRRGADAVYLARDSTVTHGDAALDRVATAGGSTIVPVADHVSAAHAEQDRMNRHALLALLGMALLCATISIANTLIMAAADRRREFALLRLAGATPRQLLRTVATEATLIAVAATALAGTLAAGTLVGLRATLVPLTPHPQIVVPWATIGAITAVCLGVAVLASLAPAALALRTPAARLAAARE
ncbi:FtsX-like permease family protein [Micromonospora sp. NPDC047465]|uniref:ABC transporter permease n=1 Tax=Micromonospora sp. NPDC047465 TaxID=3154813 RepID=UPI0034042A58